MFSPLKISTKKIRAQDQYLELQFDLSKSKMIPSQNKTWEYVLREWVQSNNASLSLAYINQQQVPIIQPLQGYEVNRSLVTLQTFFPFSSYLLYGLTLTAVIQGDGPFPDVATITNHTLFGPALISIE
jgi:hypothetical protein